MALTIKAGRYRTRDGKTATVLRHIAGTWPWQGRLSDGQRASWTNEGHGWAKDSPRVYDLIRPLRPKPKRKAGRARWGVFILCASEKQAHGVKDKILSHAQVRSAIRGLGAMELSVRKAKP